MTEISKNTTSTMSSAQTTAVAATEQAADAETAQKQQQQQGKKRKVVLIQSTSQVISQRNANDVIFRLRCEEDLLVAILLDPEGTDSRVVANSLGRFAVNTAEKYNIYTQRQMNAIDKLRGENVSVSNFLQRKIPEIDITLIKVFFATMLKNNANDHISRTLRVAAIFIGLTMCIEFRTELTPPPVHVGRFPASVVQRLTGNSASSSTTTTAQNNAAAAAAKVATDEKEQLRRDQQRGRKIDPEALATFLAQDGSELMSRLFDGAISLPEYAQVCQERYLSYKRMFIPWISRKYHESLSK